MTTHFLDEVDVLADHIVLLDKGSVKCQGSSAQLKHMYGGGYRVIAPLSAAKICNGYPLTIHQDRLVYQVPDSPSAAQLLSTFVAVGVSDVAISGPQFEDVFLSLLQEDQLLERAKSAATDDGDFDMTPGRLTSFWSQFSVLYGKRWTVFKRFWGPHVFALLLPIASTFLLGSLVKDYKTPKCDAVQDASPFREAPVLRWDQSCPEEGSCNSPWPLPRPMLGCSIW